MEGSDKVLSGKERVPSTPMTEIGDGIVGPEWDGKTE